MTLDELTQEVLDQKRDITENFVDNDEIKRYFNQFARKLNADHDFDFTKTSAGISYVDGSTEYALSAIGDNDFKAPIDLFYDYSHKFDFIDTELFKYASNVNNDVWATDNNSLFIKTSFGTATLSCDYYSTYMAKTSGGSWIKGLSVSTDEPLMPERYQDSYVEYALTRIYKKEGATEDAADSQARLDLLITNMVNDFVSKRQVESKGWKHITQMNANKNINQDAKYNPLSQ